MNTKISLFLLTCSTSIFGMFVASVKINRSKTHEAFYSTLFDKTFPEIGTKFKQLSQETKYRIIIHSGDAKSIIMSACLPGDMGKAVIMALLSNDSRAAERFYSLTLGEALEEYVKKEKQAKKYRKHENGFDLPIGFHYRASEQDCEILLKAKQATKNLYGLTDKDNKALYRLLEKDPWLIEQLELQSKFLYQHVTSEEKIEIAKRSFQQIGWALLVRQNAALVGVFNAPAIIILPFAILSMRDIKNIWKFIINAMTYQLRDSMLPVLISSYSGFYILYRFIAKYRDDTNVLLEQKKQYICF